MANYLLDTNHATGLMAQDEAISPWVGEARASGDRFGLSITVLAELYYAVYASRRRQEDLSQIAAVARARGLIVLTSDRHFRFVSGLDVQTWRG